MTPDFALDDTIVVLAGVVLGGLNRPLPATLGGFAIGFASGVLGGALPTEPEPVPAHVRLRRRHPRPARPAERALRARRRGGGARMRRFARLRCCSRPVALILATALLASRCRCRRRRTSSTRSSRSRSSSRSTSFIGNSGVLSFGHISFVALGVWTAGVLTVPASEKPAIMPSLSHFLEHDERRQRPVAPARRARRLVFAFAVGLPLMRLSGLAGRHRDLRRARDHEQRPLATTRRSGPGAQRLLVGAGDDRHLAGGDRRLDLRRRRVRVPAQPLRPAAARGARGSGGRVRGGDLHLPPASARVRRSPARSPASPAASTSTSCRSRSTRSIST